MSISKAYSAHLVGLIAEIITVEVDISNGLHSFAVVGLGDRSVDEARDRVSAAIKNSGYVSPKQKNQKVVISLAPAHVRKEGTSYDLAMAVTYLRAAGVIDFDSEGLIFLGELSLEGRLRKIGGVLPILCQIPKKGYLHAFIPTENSVEASLAEGITVHPVASLSELIAHLTGGKQITPIEHRHSSGLPRSQSHIDMNIIRGNESAKRGLEIAAAGAHNILMCGPPGTGKTMLAQSFASILPPLSYRESVEVTGIHSAARVLDQELICEAPFRAPHHTASYPAIVGGGGFPKPGEITLAHRGVLFLDEFPEFDRTVIEALRQPLEDRTITISRARGIVTFPAQCILIASMNPCPCGRGKEHGCTCSGKLLESYKRKISGPILDRLDIWINVSKIDYEKLAEKKSSAENSATIRNRIQQARKKQEDRFALHNIKKSFNAELSADDIEKTISMTDEARKTLTNSATTFQLSGRAFHRIVKVAQTIADLSAIDIIGVPHILEALQYRQKSLG